MRRRLRDGRALIVAEPVRQGNGQRSGTRSLSAWGAGAAGTPTGCGGASRFAAITKITPIAATATTTAAMISAGGGPVSTAGPESGSVVTARAPPICGTAYLWHSDAGFYTGAGRSRGQ